MTEMRKLAERFWNALETNQLDELEPLLDPDCHFKMPGADFRGFAAMKPVLAAYVAAFPDMRHHVKHCVESGDTVALELEVTGTHTGPMQLPTGVVAPTGKKVVWESCDYIRARNGRIVSWHGYYDSVPFLAALGLIAA
jgi:ketosteroid isomerase-like protein